jgi:D-proline reductase (dithiol) PrdB
MARLTDLPPAQAERYPELECPRFATSPWVNGPPLSKRRVAIVLPAGLIVRGE